MAAAKQRPHARRPQGARDDGGRRRIAGGLLLALVIQNSEDATLHLLWFEASVPLSALILGSAFFAVVVDEAIGLVWRRRRRRLLDLQDRLG